MNIYFGRRKRGVSIAIHARGKWIDFTLHNLWAVAHYNDEYMKATFFGPLLVVVGR